MVDKINNIKNLREITGAGFLDCKNALDENNGDIESSIDFLRKKGLAKANKKSSREAKEGAVGIYSNDKLLSVIQINTETDFAAKNDVFLDFMDEIGNALIDMNNIEINLDQFYKEIINGISIEDKFKNIIAKIGENIILTKLISIEKKENINISNYIHNSYRKNIGKIASTISYKVDSSNDEADLFGKNLCMHIAASKPLSMNVNDLDSKMVEREKLIQIETIKASGKPENIIDKILEGKMKKFYSESTLLNQNYILDPDKSIEQVINEFSKKNKFEILSYNLIELTS